MTDWEKKITGAFIEHYYASVPVSEEDCRIFRIRTSILFPNFDTAGSDEKESYLEAAESFERKGIVKLIWERWGKGERLKTMSCANIEKVFEEIGEIFPKTEAENIRTLLAEKVKALKNSNYDKNVTAFLEYLSFNFGPREIGQGIDRRIIEALIRLLEFCGEPDKIKNITTRALSILLYRDSKHLEKLLALCKPLLSKAEKSVSIPDLSFLERSYPEAMISGEIVFGYKSRKTPLINADGHIMGIPLENAEEIESIQCVSENKEKIVLTIENKETFYALGNPQKPLMHGDGRNLPRFNCFLYIGGYFNRAAAALIKILAASGFSFYHAGDLDIDGILILQHIQEMVDTVRAGTAVTPLRMDTETFDQYLPFARKLTKPMLRQIEKISDKTRAVPGLIDLLRRIEETGLGIEQEIIDYR